MNENPPQVSVVMPAYNATDTITEALHSLWRQTCSDWELIVVDDASTDDTVELVASLAEDDPRIRLIVLDANSGGPAHPRNVGIREAVGKYIAFLDADDLWLPTKLERQLYYMGENGAVISCCAYDVIDVDGNPAGRFVPPLHNTYEGLLRENTIGCLTAMYNASVIGKKYFPSCGHEDFALWLEMLRDGLVVHGLQETLAVYRLRAGSVSADKMKVIGYFWNIFRNEGFSLWRSALYCLRYGWHVRSKYKRVV